MILTTTAKREIVQDIKKMATSARSSSIDKKSYEPPDGQVSAGFFQPSWNGILSDPQYYLQVDSWVSSKTGSQVLITVSPS